MLYIWLLLTPFRFTEERYRMMPCYELYSETEPGGSRGRGATLKPGIIRYDLKTELRLLFAGCQLILLQLDNVHLERSMKIKAARGDSKEHMMETN